MKVRISLAAGAIGLGLFTAGLRADAIVVDPIEVGTGPFSSFVQIDFEQGETFVFEVFYSDVAETTGFDLLLTLEETSSLGFEIEYDMFAFGPFVTGIGFNDIFESGDGSGGQGFWGYWAKTSMDESWSFPGVGTGDNLVSDGSWEGWVFGTGLAPKDVIIPAPAATAALGGLLIGYGRRRRQA